MRIPTPEELTTHRLLAGLTQAQAAKMAGVSRNTWIRYEKGQRGIPRAVVQRCSKMLSDDPFQIRRNEIADHIGYRCRTAEELKEQIRLFAAQALKAWQAKPFYVDEHGITRRRSDNAPCGPRGGKS